MPQVSFLFSTGVIMPKNETISMMNNVGHSVKYNFPGIRWGFVLAHGLQTTVLKITLGGKKKKITLGL